MSRRSSVTSPIYEKCRPRNDGKTKKNVDLIQDLTKTFIMDDDSAFSADRDNAEDSDSSDVKG